MLIDTHIHLDAKEFDADREALLKDARQTGVECFVVPSVGRCNHGAVAALALRHADVFPAFGIHPLYVQHENDGESLALLEQYLAGPRVVAVSEIGLDHYVKDSDWNLQERFFVAQLKLARRLALPVVLHVRHAVDAVLKQLRRIEVPGGIAHAFNGSRQQADMLMALGFKLGFGGAMTYSSSRRIRELAATLPLDALVLETDAPDMPPAWADGQRNIPSSLVRYAAELAALRGMTIREVVQRTGQNAMDALPRLKNHPCR